MSDSPKNPGDMSNAAYAYVQRSLENQHQVKVSYENSAAGRQEAILKEIARNSSNLDELKEIAASTKSQAETAAKQADDAEQSAHAAKRESIITRWIAIITLVVTALSWLIPREDAARVLSSFLNFFRELLRKVF